MNKNTDNRQAFTLFELLVTMVIISILVSLLMPTIAMVRATAHTVVCASNLRQLDAAMRDYSIDNRGRLLPVAEMISAYAAADDGTAWGCSRASWDVRLADWTDGGSIGVTHCPANWQALRATVTSSLSGKTWVGRRSYAMPVPDVHADHDVYPQLKTMTVAWYDNERHTAGSMLAARIQDPSGTARLIESWDWNIGWTNEFGQTWGCGSYSNEELPAMGAYGLTVRHRNRTNALFCDGHVALTTREELSGGPGVGTCPWAFKGAWTTVAGD